MRHGEIAARTSEAREAVASDLMAKHIWTAVKLVEEAETNLYASREARQFGPANKAVEIIARLTGNLDTAGKSVGADIQPGSG